MGTGIQWTDETWNPTVGCDRISPGCARCYAKNLHDKRHKAFLAGKAMAPQYAQPFEVLQTIAARLDAPLDWRKPRKIFVNSVSDLFHEDVPDEFIDQVFAVMALAPQHTFQILTKRAERMRQYVTHAGDTGLVGVSHAWANHRPMPNQSLTWPLPNVWLGVSVENQRFADERIPLLLQTPAAVRFISAEPLLGPVDLNGLPDVKGDPSWDVSALHGVRECAFGATVSREMIARLDWVIVGGESGKDARPFNLAWGRSIVTQCRAAGVACFVKQLGANPTHDRPTHLGEALLPLDLRDSHGGDPLEWPEDLRVRQMPAGRP
jgi:protein gp37